MALPLAGAACQLTWTLPLAGEATTSVGAPGVVEGTIGPDVATGLVPVGFSPVRVTVYVVPFSRPVNFLWVTVAGTVTLRTV
jgi:hypothetical protein